MTSKNKTLVLMICLVSFFSCQKDSDVFVSTTKTNDREFKSAGFELDPMTVLDDINALLSAQNVDYRAMKAEFLGNGSPEGLGHTVIAKDVGNKQLDFDFVPNDPRRVWSGPAGGANDDITYVIDQPDAVPLSGGVSDVETTDAIEAAMATWADVNCSDLLLTRNPDFGLDIGYLASILGFGGLPFIFADIHHTGFSDINFAGGVIGATITFGFTNGDGTFTDVDQNGKADVAFREIYYDPSWSWAIGDNVDVESVALHEMGHGLSQGHFGTVKVKKNGTIKASPRAVMNAVYFEPKTALSGNDNGGHCSNWGQWPNN